jgi:hypothetical protein|tara:strand:+ start:64 stop:345 length:282 start_codon:yes stop_codon:yes gene_type:complete
MAVAVLVVWEVAIPLVLALEVMVTALVEAEMALVVFLLICPPLGAGVVDLVLAALLKAVKAEAVLAILAALVTQALLQSTAHIKDQSWRILQK